MRGDDHPLGIKWDQMSRLEVLELEDARSAFKDMTGLHSEANAPLDELLTDLGCLPLAITLLARLARQGESISALHRRWKAQRTGLLSGNVLSRSPSDRHYDLDYSIKLSIDSSPMKNDDHALRLLGILACLPEGISADSMDKLGIFPINDIYRASFILRSVGLAYHDNIGTLKLLSPVRFHVATHCAAHPKDLLLLQNYYLDLASLAEEAIHGKTAPKSVPEQLRSEFGNMHAVLRDMISSSEVDAEEVASAILSTSKIFYWCHIPTSDLLVSLLDGRKLNISVPLQAACLHMLGTILQVLNDYPPAIQAFQEAVCLYTSTGDYFSLEPRM